VALKTARRTTRRRQPDDGPPVYTPSKRRSDTENDGPLGVPDGYTAPYVRDTTGMSPRGVEGWSAAGAGTGSIGQRTPAYYEDDVLKPATLDPGSIGQLQGALAAAGLLGDFRYGIWDEDSQDAYRSLLGEANAAGLSAMAMLQNRASTVDMPGAGSENGRGHWEMDESGNAVWVDDPYVAPPLELRTTNKADLANVFRAAVIDKMGEGWSQQQINELVDAYNWQEIKVQTDAYNAQVALERADWEGTRGTGGETITTEQAPSPEAFLDEQLRAQDPEGYQAGQLINETIPQFMSMMGGWTQ
jgi:hypothetical protein